MDEYQQLKRSIGFYMGQTSRAMKGVMNKMFMDNGFNVTSEQWHILMSLWFKNGQTQHELISVVSKEKATVTRLIDGLEKRKLIVRLQNKDDRRKKIVMLTDEGMNLKSKLMPIANEILEKAAKDFTPEELEIFKSMLVRITNNLKEC